MNTEPEGFVPIEKVSNYFAVSPATVRVWVNDKVIPPHCYIKIGRTYRFSIPAITTAFLEANTANNAGSNQVDIDFSTSDEGQE